MFGNLVMGHLVGDYILQTDWMAVNKKKGSFPCLVHCVLYTLAVGLFAWGALPLWGWVVVFVTHFAIDRFYLVWWYTGMTGQENFMKPPFGPWSGVLHDNIWHLLTLLLLSKFV